MPLALFRVKDNPANPTKRTEKRLGQVRFTVHKLNNRPRPKSTDRIKIISCFSEFGCEVLGCLYCIPRLLRRFPGQYVIAMGWQGREYLYRHLVDEFWELDEEYMWLRDYTRAFHHTSRNLKKIEEEATLHGQVIPAVALGKYAVSNFCRTCGKFWHEWRRKSDDCPACGSTVIIRSVFTDIGTYKPEVRFIPKPRSEYLNWADGVVKPNSIGIFARGRKTYGRNMPIEFYVKLIGLLEGMGHNVIWLGEKQSTPPCPVDHVLDFSRMPEAMDLERTLAIICKLQLTVQFWTASTRLSGIMGVPFLLFESPEQVYASISGLQGAQEGKRLELCSFGNKKLVLSHYRNALENEDEVLKLVQRAIEEMKIGNWTDILGLVEDKNFTSLIQEEHYEMLT